MKKITYSKSGVNYAKLDPVKKLAQTAAKRTAKNLKNNGFREVTESRGESAYVWQQGNVLMASVMEGLGTKNLVADEMNNIFPGRTYYDVISHDTVAAIINDLVSSGAEPLVIHAYWGVGDDGWFGNKKRVKDLIAGWESACNVAGIAWGGGETPSLKGIIEKDKIELGGSAVGIIKNKKNLIGHKKLKHGDRLILLKSNGINCNGLSLARSVAGKLPSGYATRIDTELNYGEALLTKTNIYARLVKNLVDEQVEIHYISNITGHGLRKIMRARGNFTYIIEKVFESQEIFKFIQKHANLDDYEMYQTYNMGQDYTIFIDPKDVKKTLDVIKKNGFEGLNAGYVEKGPRRVIIKPKNITFTSETLDLR